eukprot:Tbor_TRINITY_DN3133_c0_g1::TRINITY_DN3133_c0_g1_i1::g.14609::m.14609
MVSLLWLIGASNAVIYYAADLCLSFTLSRLKVNHPAIDDAGDYNVRYSGYENIGGNNPKPDEDLTVDPVTAVLSAARNGKEEFENLFQNIKGIAIGQETQGADGGNFQILTREERIEKAVYLFVVGSSIIAPFFCLIQILFPNSVPWSMWHVPSWLGFLIGIPGLMVSIFYAARATRIATFSEVTKVQWLSYSWFRMDVMCVMGLVLLLGWGNWIVAFSIFITCFYFTHRLMRIEKRLQRAVSRGQLMGDGHAVNIQPVMAGMVRGAVEMGYQDHEYAEVDDIDAANMPARNVYGAVRSLSSEDTPEKNFMKDSDSKKKKNKKKATRDQSNDQEMNEISE